MVAGACSTICGAVVRRAATTLRLIDVPNQRSSHAYPTPMGGGIGIVIGTVGAMLSLSLAGLDPSQSLTITLVSGGSLVAVVSCIDDVRPLSAAVRLTTHVIAAAIAVWYIGPISTIQLSSGITFGPLVGGLISLVWIVGLVNAYNFMDGIDGMAGGQAIMASAGLAVVGLLGSQFELVIVGSIVTATSAGFLVHNWPPGRLFMGDVGSAFLGYVIAVSTLAGARENPAIGPIGVALSWPFVFDTSWTLLRRLRLRENLFDAHRSHLYQRLVATGPGHAVVTGLYLALAAFGIGAGVGAFVFPSAALWTLLVYSMSSALVMLGLVWRYESGSSSTSRVAPKAT